MNDTILKLTNGQKGLNILFGSQKHVYDKGSFGFSDYSDNNSQNSDSLDSIFVSNSKSHAVSIVVCNYCENLIICLLHAPLRLTQKDPKLNGYQKLYLELSVFSCFLKLARA